MGEPENYERDRYYPDEDRPLSIAILEAIGEQKGEDVTKADFQLYDDIDPDALDNLFREHATGGTTVKFDTDGVTVALWGDGAVDIRIAPRDDDD